MSANPRDPAFEEALHAVMSASLDMGRQRCFTDFPCEKEHSACLAAHDAAVTRAVRDTIERCASKVESLAKSLKENKDEGHLFVIGMVASTIAYIRALAPTPERLYTKDELDAAVEAALQAERESQLRSCKPAPVPATSNG